MDLPPACVSVRFWSLPSTTCTYRFYLPAPACLRLDAACRTAWVCRLLRFTCLPACRSGIRFCVSTVSAFSATVLSFLTCWNFCTRQTCLFPACVSGLLLRFFTYTVPAAVLHLLHLHRPLYWVHLPGSFSGFSMPAFPACRFPAAVLPAAFLQISTCLPAGGPGHLPLDYLPFLACHRQHNVSIPFCLDYCTWVLQVGLSAVPPAAFSFSGCCCLCNSAFHLQILGFWVGLGACTVLGACFLEDSLGVLPFYYDRFSPGSGTLEVPAVLELGFCLPFSFSAVVHRSGYHWVCRYWVTWSGCHAPPAPGFCRSPPAVDFPASGPAAWISLPACLGVLDFCRFLPAGAWVPACLPAQMLGAACMPVLVPAILGSACLPACHRLPYRYLPFHLPPGGLLPHVLEVQMQITFHTWVLLNSACRYLRCLFVPACSFSIPPAFSGIPGSFL